MNLVWRQCSDIDWHVFDEKTPDKIVAKIQKVSNMFAVHLHQTDNVSCDGRCKIAYNHLSPEDSEGGYLGETSTREEAERLVADVLHRRNINLVRWVHYHWDIGVIDRFLCYYDFYRGSKRYRSMAGDCGYEYFDCHCCDTREEALEIAKSERDARIAQLKAERDALRKQIIKLENINFDREECNSD